MRRRWFPRSVWLGGWLLLAAAICRAVGGPSEYDVKAAYLLNILKFVDRAGAPRGGEYFTLGLHGAGAIGQSILPLEGSSMHGRKLRLRTINVESDLDGCDVVFFGSSTARTNRILSKAEALGLFTVGNDAGFVPGGGMMALIVESRKVVLEVNGSATGYAGWSISSHLLEMARIVNRAHQ